METFVAELVGTALLIILGDGVVAGVVLNKTKAQNAGWMVITTGWAVGVAMGVYTAGRISSEVCQSTMRFNQLTNPATPAPTR